MHEGDEWLEGEEWLLKKYTGHQTSLRGKAPVGGELTPTR